jgi:hypothetical protein
MSRILTKESERRRIEKSFEVFGLTPRQRGLILEALDSDAWDWFEDCDGCTGVSELTGQRSISLPACGMISTGVAGTGGSLPVKTFTTCNALTGYRNGGRDCVRRR